MFLVFKNSALQIGIKRFLLLDKEGKILSSSAIITFGNMSQWRSHDVLRR